MCRASSPAAEIPAATLVVFRRSRTAGAPEILMVERARALSFAGGAAVFPGGRVDDEDRCLAASLRVPRCDTDEAAHRIAAIRETFEETGLLVATRQRVAPQAAAAARRALEAGTPFARILEANGWDLDAEALTPFARWLPRGMSHSRIFDTRFYLTDLGTGEVSLAVDETENTRLFWTSADAALRRADDGRLRLIFPTRRNLERLARFRDFAAARAQAEAVGVRTICPAIVEEDGSRWLTIPDGLGYPVTRERLDTAMRD
ncbi:NUDIX domain-containing protein [Erythrobacteraceae bacterium CFH 75059]|nr:NUDIX domain-containing protein [Erythrobacteraceae bacterium CFH 75059]